MQIDFAENYTCVFQDEVQSPTGDSVCVRKLFDSYGRCSTSGHFADEFLETVLPQFFLLTMIAMTGCMPIINICTRLAIRFRLFPFGVNAGFEWNEHNIFLRRSSFQARREQEVL